MNWKTPSVILLTWVNLIPVIGILFWGWNIQAVLVLYWFESIMIGLLNIPKILMCGGGLHNLFLAAFFTAHYGGFAFGHMEALKMLFNVSHIQDYRFLYQGFTFALISLFISHLFSLWHNFIRRKEYQNRDGGKQMITPYHRVFIMHFIIIFGGIFIGKLGSELAGDSALGFFRPEYLVVLLILLKIALDVRAHVKERLS